MVLAEKFNQGKFMANFTYLADIFDSLNSLNPFDAVGTYMSQGIAKQYQKFISALEMPWDGIDRCLTASRIT